MTDLSPSELDEYGDSTGACDHLVTVRMVAEIRRHRAAVAADEERARSVVRALLVEADSWSRVDGFAERFCDRAAKQLAGSAVRLSATDAIDIEQARDYIASSVGWNAFPDPADAAKVFLVPARWLDILDRLLATVRP